MRATDVWSASQRPTVSFELFPARSEKAAANLEKAIDRLAALEPDFVSVTFGAGGSMREGSRQLIEKLKVEKGLEIIAYFAGYGLGPADIVAVLDSYQELGVENVLVVRGDPPHGDEVFTPHPDSLPHATDLLAFVRARYDFCLGAAGYPEGHIECESPEKDLEYLELKVAQGAEYIIANYFYDNRFFLDFVARCRAAGVRVPIIPGVMPVYSVKMMETLANLCGATITDELRRGLAALPEGDKDALVAFGVDFAASQCRGLLEAGVPGLHIYTMDQSRSTVGIVKQLREEGLLGPVAS
ncbi:MAG: methylenetetrahydrofolate reductase [Candidatus Brocadiia bacterium]|nr:methylenetetrahydrofolate reductase [Candidatus Brocadiia bacterium]